MLCCCPVPVCCPFTQLPTLAPFHPPLTKTFSGRHPWLNFELHVQASDLDASHGQKVSSMQGSTLALPLLGLRLSHPQGHLDLHCRQGQLSRRHMLKPCRGDPHSHNGSIPAAPRLALAIMTLRFSALQAASYAPGLGSLNRTHYPAALQRCQLAARCGFPHTDSTSRAVRWQGACLDPTIRLRSAGTSPLYCAGPPPTGSAPASPAPPVWGQRQRTCREGGGQSRLVVRQRVCVCAAPAPWQAGAAAGQRQEARPALCL